MLLSGVVFLSVILNNGYCFNIDINNPIVYQDPTGKSSNKTSYFGYSVILYPGNRSSKPWILTGAPRGEGSSTKFKNTGVCYKCGIMERCDVARIEVPPNSNYVEKMDDAWLGGSMDINYATERIVICSHRWIKIKMKGGKDDDYNMQGTCYWSHVNDNTTQMLLPLLEPGGDVYTDRTTQNSVYLYGQGQAGFSVHMPRKGKEVVLGAPGVFNWDGTPILFKDDEESAPVASRLRNKPKRYADPDEFNYKIIGNALLTRQTIAYDLLGYSSSSGYFYSRNNYLYVSSAPRSNKYRGQVLIYRFGKPNEALIVQESKYGNQFGEYFGGSITVGDINGDKLDDLIVGAPFHKAAKYNEGKVYIFLGSRMGRLQVPKGDAVVGKSTNGQFGSTVQYLGDIDHDGFGDVAVAAPYEEEKSGVVYLYKGTKDGLDTIHCQRIVGKEIHPTIKGFGISISRPADIDLNRYSDLAIGAYLSGHVVLLRSRPVVTIYQSLQSFISHLDFSQKSFDMSACFWYQLDQSSPGTISIRRTLVVDQQLERATLQSNNYMKKIDFTENQRYCENFTVVVQNSEFRDYDPITISLSHKFVAEKQVKEVVVVSSEIVGSDRFCPRCPVYNSYGSVSSTTVKIPFALDCGTDNICKSRIKFNSKVTNLGLDNTFVLGSMNYITLQTDVENFGEKAYLAQMLVMLPETVYFRSTPSACMEHNSSTVLCSVGNPLDRSSRKSVILDIDMTNVNGGKFDDSLVFTVKVLTNSENDGDQVKQLVVKLQREADVTISGKSEEQSYSYRNASQGRSDFVQIYQVEKFGRSLLNEIFVEINIPHVFKVNDELINFLSLYPVSGNLADQEIACNSAFTYISEEKQTGSLADLSAIDNDNAGERLRRSASQVEVFNKSTIVRERMIEKNGFDAFQNRTYYINCSMAEVVCSKITCTAGPIRSGQIVNIKVKMLFNISSLEDYLGKKDVILLGTQGRVFVKSPKNFVQSGDRPDDVEVGSLFVGESAQEKVQLWIIIISAVAGLLLLLLVILGLIKAGFFKRKTKEELEQLKKEMECQDAANLNMTEEM
jgi:hypothetical protein